jgi:Zn-dependent protease
MSVQQSCEQCGMPLEGPDRPCPRCGAVAGLAPAGGAPSEPVFAWHDGQGHAWRLVVQGDGLVLDGQDAPLVVQRDHWKKALSFTRLDANAVVHVDGGTREIGFLVPMEEAVRLYLALYPEPTGPNLTLTTPMAPPVATVRLEQTASPSWPKMTAMPVIALTLSLFAFIPLVGCLCALASGILALLALRRARRDAAHLHVRVMAKASLLIAAVGVGVCVLSTYVLWQSNQGPEALELSAAGEIGWSWGAGIAALFMMIMALTVHEAAHAITAWWCGDDYARSLGRVTLNPLAHIDPFGTVLLPMLLAYMNLPVFGYARPVPVRLGGLRHYRRAQILVSAAGPVSNLMQAAACLSLLLMTGSLLHFVPGVSVRHLADWEPIVEVSGVAGASVIGAVALLLKLGFYINVLLAFFNLIPVPPLDGSWILEHLFPRTIGRVYAAVRPFGFLLFMALLWAPSQLVAYLLMPGLIVALAGYSLVYGVTGF